MSDLKTLAHQSKLKPNTENIFLKNKHFQHGGQLLKAIADHDLPISEWIDLSTGINPNGYAVKNIPASVWNQLPDDNDNLLSAAAKYYDCNSILAVPGSQAAIQIIPQLFTRCRVGIVQPSYFEHEKAWAQARHELLFFNFDNNINQLINSINKKISNLDILIIVNPNNPTGHKFDSKTLLQWCSTLKSRNAYLIVDEAFIDCDMNNHCNENFENDTNEKNSQNLFKHIEHSNLIVLRSMGKFFGLAGIRVGFVFSNKHILHRISEILGPWTLSGPSRYIATTALQDVEWQRKTRIKLKQNALRLRNLLRKYDLITVGNSDLFQWFTLSQAHQLHVLLKRFGILTREFHHPNSIRIGLPKNEHQWHKLEHVLSICLDQIKTLAQPSCTTS